MKHRMVVGIVMAASAALWHSTATLAESQDDVTQPIARVESIVVNSVTVNNGQLQANATVTLDVIGNTVTENVVIPLDLAGTAGPEGECDILNVAVGPLALNLLGLVVELDDCADGPVTVDITAIDGGGLLGDLLCEVAGALADGSELSVVLGGLTAPELATLTGGLRDLINSLIEELIITGTSSTGDGGDRRRCDILLLELPDGLHLSLLGLDVDTSGICLDVFAVRGANSSLGNLLCALTNVLDSRGGARLEKVLVRQIEQILEGL
jgi:hypothetical protein